MEVWISRFKTRDGIRPCCLIFKISADQKYNYFPTPCNLKKFWLKFRFHFSNRTPERLITLLFEACDSRNSNSGSLIAVRSVGIYESIEIRFDEWIPICEKVRLWTNICIAENTAFFANLLEFFVSHNIWAIIIHSWSFQFRSEI